MPTTVYFKGAALFAVICLNLVFVFFAISRSIQRGKEWQNAFMAASIVQILIEVFVYETMECFWMQYLLPSSIRQGDTCICIYMYRYNIQFLFRNKSNASVYGKDCGRNVRRNCSVDNIGRSAVFLCVDSFGTHVSSSDGERRCVVVSL